MNKRLHRVVFNAARGLRVVVQETARVAGKAGGATALVSAAVLMAAWPVSAQIVGAPGVPPNLRPTVLVAPNGVPLVNIQTPSAAGVSRNLYHQFDVQPRGVILNNSRTDAQTQLGGWVQGNPYLATGPARVILNEITSGNPTQLRGAIEVGGQRAEVVVANPAGIAVDGATFINASRATLTTGTPQLNALGGLDGYVVRGGTVTIDGAGLDARSTDYAAILARAVQVNAGIWANELKVVTGANQVSADHAQATPTAGIGTAPVFALDVSHLGGMYTNKIFLVGTEAGLGARNAGAIQAAGGGTLAGPGEFVVTAAGRLENSGTIQATGRGEIAAESLANSGRIASGGDLRIATQGPLGNAGGTLEATSLQVAAAGDIDNRGGTLRQTSGVGLTISAPALSNTAGGVIGAEPVPEAPVQPGSGSSEPAPPGTSTGTNTGTETAAGGGAGSTGTTSSPSYVPARGHLTASGAILNDGGRIYAGGAIQLQTPQVNNSGGAITATSLAASGPSFSNAGGTLHLSQSFSAEVERFDNTGGILRAGSLQIASRGDLINQDGQLVSDGDATLRAGASLNNTRGTLLAAGSATLQGARIDLSAGTTSAAHIALTATQGHVTTSGATVTTPGTLSVTAIRADANATITSAGSVDNSAGGLISAGDTLSLVDPNAASPGAKTLAVKNTGSTLLAGQALTIDAGALTFDGKLLSKGDMRLALNQDVVIAAGSQTVANRDLSLATSGNITNSGKLAAGRGLLLAARHIDNTATGDIQGAITTLQATGTVTNRGVIDGAISHYLIETDPRFANHRQWLSSDYLLAALGSDPAWVQKRLGDGYYEQRLIREQVAQLTGHRYLDGFESDDAQYAALMNAGATFAKEYGLRPGVALTAAQMAQLTSDIVWLVEQEVSLPDGSTQRVLVPQVYVRVKEGDIDGSGALLAGRSVNMRLAGDLSTAGGTIAGREAVVISAENIHNLAGRITGQDVALRARNDLNVIGGTIEAGNSLAAIAGRDINVVTTTRTAQQSTVVPGAGASTLGAVTLDRVAGLYVSNPGGSLLATAGRDMNLVGAEVQSGGDARLSAERDLNLDSITTGRAEDIRWSGKNSREGQQSQETGTTVSGAGHVSLTAGRDLTGRAATLNAGETLSLGAGGKLTLRAGENSTSAETHHATGKGMTKYSLDADSRDTTLARTSLSGQDIQLRSGGDMTLGAVEANAERMDIRAGGRLHLLTQSTTSARSAKEVDNDAAFSSVSGSGRTDETSQYNRFNVKELSIRADGGVRAQMGQMDSLASLAQQPGMGWVNQLANDPAFANSVEWQRVKEEHDRWSYHQSGMGPVTAMVVSVVAAAVAAPIAAQAGAAAGGSTALATGEGVALTSGGVFMGASAPITAGVSAAVQAGVTALASRAAVSLANNEGDLGRVLQEMGSSEAVKGIVSSMLTAGVIDGLGASGLLPANVANATDGSARFMDQLQRQLKPPIKHWVLLLARSGVVVKR